MPGPILSGSYRRDETLRTGGGREPDAVALRAPDHVMRLARLGSFHQTRLSFMRVLLRRLYAERWRFERPLWRVDDRGEGVAVYRVCGNGRAYDLVCFPHDLDPAKRTDRVIADEWDATFVLRDGDTNEETIARLARNVPLQEAGRCTSSEIILSRANKSVRLFDHVVERLAAGVQPDQAEIDKVGYLMRTTAVYGNGKFGLCDRDRIADRPEFAGPFSAEMLAVWLIRAFSVDLAEHMAAVREPGTAVRLDSALRRRLGIGNSTGLGMAPFLINHQSLLHRWIFAREMALARVRALPAASEGRIAAFRNHLVRARHHVSGWRTDDEIQSARIAGLAVDLERIEAHLGTGVLEGTRPWDAVYRWGEQNLSLEGQELLVTLLIEPHGDLVDDLADAMAADEDVDFPINGAMSIGTLRRRIREHYAFALAIDFSRPGTQARFWYVSEEKLEPRLGEREAEPGAEREQPMAVARDVAALDKALGQWPADGSVAAFLMAAPEHRHVVRRVQVTARKPYAEIRDNLIDQTARPIDLLRCKLSFFGATRFDPKSDRWVRVVMYQHAPFPEELLTDAPDEWALPPVEGRA